MGFLKEFKEFAMKGNVVDMAVGVIIGGAFGKIVTSLVNDIIMPPIGVITGGVDFKDLSVVLQKGVDFTILAFCVFLLVKFINMMTKKKEEAPAPAPAPEPSKEEVLLTEIRDLLKEKK